MQAIGIRQMPAYDMTYTIIICVMLSKSVPKSLLTQHNAKPRSINAREPVRNNMSELINNCIYK